LDPFEFRPLNVSPQFLLREKKIRVYNRERKRWTWATGTEVRNNRVEVTYLQSNRKDSFNIRDDRLALHHPRFAIGEYVSAFKPNLAWRMDFTIFHGQVVKHHADGSYSVELVTGTSVKTIDVPEY